MAVIRGWIWVWLLLVWNSGAATAEPPACASCHPRETARYIASPMGRSIGPAELIPAGQVKHAASGSVLKAEYRVERGTRKLFHLLSERGLTAEYPVAYQIGAGAKARTFAVRVGEYLLESPLSWYKAARWDVSPGYEAMQVLDFDRPITENCLFCHADRAKATDADGRRIPEAAVTSISCERCHGASAEHVLRPSTTNIVNPAKLTGAARDSVCEQCHLEGETRLVNPGKTQWDYRPGQRMEDTIITYLIRRGSASNDGRAVNQEEELAMSQCARVSGGKLWCGSCHDPHGDRGDRSVQVNAVCGSCHRTLSLPAHPPNTGNCVECHMTSRPASNVAHLAVTDHRLLRPGHSSPTEEPASGWKLVPWREGPARFERRNAALAGLQISAGQHLPELAQQSMKLLDTIPEAQQNSDPDVLSSLEVLFLGTSGPEKAVALSGWAVESSPSSATFALNHGQALLRAGNYRLAEAELLRARELDPSLMQAAAQLAVLYDRTGRRSESRSAIERFLRWNPQNIQFRLTGR